MLVLAAAGEPGSGDEGNEAFLADQPRSKVIHLAGYPAEDRAAVGKPADTSPKLLAKPVERRIPELSLLNTGEPLPVGMAGMNEGDMRNALVDHGFASLALIKSLTLPEGRPVTRVVMNGPAGSGRDNDDMGNHDRAGPATRSNGLPDESLDGIFAGGTPIVWTAKDTELALMFWAPIYYQLEPIAEEDELWVPIHRSMIWRRYYDVTMERYGWELAPLDLKTEWGQYYVTGVGLNGAALVVDRITVDDYKYKPGGQPPFRHSSNDPFTAINTGGRVSWIWRQAYTVHFDKFQLPLTRIASGPSNPTGPGLVFDLSTMQLEDDR